MTRLVRLMSALAGAAFLLAIAAVAGAWWLVFHYDGDLPDYRQLATYEPATLTRVHAGDGRLLAEYAREKRVFVPVEAMPERLKQAFIAASTATSASTPPASAGRCWPTSRTCAATAGRRVPPPSPSRWRRTSCSATSCR